MSSSGGLRRILHAERQGHAVVSVVCKYQAVSLSFPASKWKWYGSD